MKLSEVSIRRPVFATVLSLLVLLIGMVSFTKLSVREYPKIDEPVVTVSVKLRRAHRPRSWSRRSPSRWKTPSPASMRWT
jgi:Cu/Ag efflux pump CusA